MSSIVPRYVNLSQSRTNAAVLARLAAQAEAEKAAAKAAAKAEKAAKAKAEAEAKSAKPVEPPPAAPPVRDCSHVAPVLPLGPRGRLRKLMRDIAQHQGTSVEAIKGRGQRQGVVYIRFALAWIGSNRLGLSGPAMAIIMGRDPSTIVSARQRVDAALAAAGATLPDDPLEAAIQIIELLGRR